MDVQPGTSTLNGQVPTTGLSVTEAAQVLGVSSNTVRSRIKAGKLRAERAQRPQGEVIRVFLDPVNLPAGTNVGTFRHVQSEVPVGTSSQVPAVRQAEQLATVLIPLVEAAVAPLRAELADTRAALETARQELGAALERIRGLEAPREPSTVQIAPRGATDGLSVEPSHQPTAQRRSWWRLW